MNKQTGLGSEKALDSSILKLQDALVDTELLGERFLDASAQMVELDKRRQELREALTALRKQQQAGSSSSQASAGPGPGSTAAGSSSSGGSKVWVRFKSGTFAKVAAGRAKEMMEQEQRDIEAEITRLRGEQKKLTALLADRGAGPQGMGPGMLNAMLNLRDSKGKGQAGGGGGAGDESWDSDDDDE